MIKRTVADLKRLLRETKKTFTVYVHVGDLRVCTSKSKVLDGLKKGEDGEPVDPQTPAHFKYRRHHESHYDRTYEYVFIDIYGVGDLKGDE